MPTSDDQFPSQYPSIVFNLELGSKVTDDSCEQFLNVPTPIFSTLAGIWIDFKAVQFAKAPVTKGWYAVFAYPSPNSFNFEPCSKVTTERFMQSWYLQPIITQYFIDNKSEIWLLFLIAHSKRWRFNAFIDY